MSQWFPHGHYRTPVVLRLKLREFTVGHWLLLTELESPLLVKTDQIPKPSDFFLAVLICSTDSISARRILNRRWLPLFARFWMWTVRKLDAYNEVSKWHKYIQASFAGPQTIGSVHQAAESIPSVLSVITMLAWKMHQPIRDILEMPVYQAVIACASYQDFHGEAEFWTERHQELWDHAQQMSKARN